ncbi:MAG: hypothetical protein H6933_01495 [Burkholderiaceae bacterium]|nr:hypothetical protein [Rhodoferax sp.]MCP5283553.1 hypothetical protein [Burkholderiaceae bacterium]
MAAAPESPPTTPLPTPCLGAVHERRLRALWRSAGWPCHDVVEAELLLAGALQRAHDEAGRETLRLTDAGLALIAAAVQRNRRARDRHEALVGRVAREMQRNGRVVWRGLSLRAPPQVEVEPKAGDGPARAGAWAMAMPDVFSIRHTTVEDYVEPVVHEIKVRRADLLSDLRKAPKREAYRAIASQCWYVLQAGIGSADEIPPDYGVMLAHGEAEAADLEVLRQAPKRAMRLPFITWMALARATAEPPLDDDAQPDLGPAI